MTAGGGIFPPSERERLLRAFAELLAERGYEATTVEEICGRAMVAPEAFQRIFGGSRERCAAAAEDAILSEVLAKVGRSYSADRSEWDNVIHGVKAILELMAANPSFAHLGYIGARQMGPPAAREAYETGHQMLEAMLERGQAYSQGATGPPKTALAALGGAEAICRREVAAGRAAELPRLLPDFVYAATVPFLGQEEALRLVRRAREVLGEAA
ncbi:MAG TPA: TetR family transcriptional regulator [Solirubrobacterales bacterium]|nr:TetR family transcriptional regulator [Solirubrobacterales bacterium]